jgi:hypothetical protein
MTIISITKSLFNNFYAGLVNYKFNISLQIRATLIDYFISNIPGKNYYVIRVGSPKFFIRDYWDMRTGEILSNLRWS